MVREAPKLPRQVRVYRFAVRAPEVRNLFRGEQEGIHQERRGSNPNPLWRRWRWRWELYRGQWLNYVKVRVEEGSGAPPVLTHEHANERGLVFVLRVSAAPSSPPPLPRQAEQLGSVGGTKCVS